MGKNKKFKRGKQDPRIKKLFEKIDAKKNKDIKHDGKRNSRTCSSSPE